MKNKEKDNLAKFLFSFVVLVLEAIVGLMFLGTFMGGVSMLLGAWAGSLVDVWLGFPESRVPGPFALFGVFAGGLVFFLGPILLIDQMMKWEELKEKSYAWCFLDYTTDLLSAFIRGVGSILVSAGLGAAVGGLVVVGILLVKLYCNHVGIPFPPLSPTYWQTIIACGALVRVLWQQWEEEHPAVMTHKP